MSSRRRRPRHTQPLRQQRPRPARLYNIDWSRPDGQEIEITVDINDPNTDPVLLDLIHQMTDNCPHCKGEGNQL